MNGLHLILGRSRGWLCVCLAAVCLSLGVPRQALCQDEPDAKQMAGELRAAIGRSDWTRTEQLIRDLQALGEPWLPAIKEAMSDCDKGEALYLIHVLVGIGGK